MNDGKHCPACGKDIGLWAVLLAAWPSRVRCPHCRARLSYGSCIVLVAILVSSLAVLFVGAFGFLVYEIHEFGLGRSAFDKGYQAEKHREYKNAVASFDTALRKPMPR